MGIESNSKSQIDKNFKEIINLLNNSNINYWLCHGTLLGIIRDNELIPWDHDIDIAVWKQTGLKEKFKKVIIKFLMKITYPKANQVIGVSNKLSNDLSIFVKTNVKTIYSPSFDTDIIKKSRETINLNKKFESNLKNSNLNTSEYRSTLKQFKRFLKDDVFKNLLKVMLIVTTEKESSKLLSESVADYFSKHKKRHNYLLFFLKKILTFLISFL